MDINMIKKLIQLDHDACKQIEEIESEQKQESLGLQLDKEELSKKYEEKAVDRLSKAKIAADLEEKENKEFFDKKFSETSAEMEKIFEENKERWVNEIFNNIIG